MSKTVHTLLQKHLNWEPAKVKLEEISLGFTNQSYRAVYDGVSYFVRLHADHPERRAISREREVRCLCEAASLGIAPEVVCHSEDLLVLHFIEGVHKSTSEDPGELGDLVDCFASLHQRTKSSHGLHPAVLTREFIHIPGVKEVLSTSAAPVNSLLDRIESTVDIPLFALCHMDPNPWNVLYTDEGVYLLDWEYAAHSDPVFDVAMLAIHHSFSIESCTHLLERYTRQASLEVSADKMKQYYILATIRRGLWNAMHHLHTKQAAHKQAAERWLEKALVDGENA